MGKDINLKVTLRSARILSAVEDAFGSQTEMARKTGIGLTRINGFVCMRVSPISHGEFNDNARNFAAALGKYPDEIWPEHMRDIISKRSTTSIELNMSEVAAISSTKEVERRVLIEKLEEALSDRELLVIDMLKSGSTLSEIGDEICVSPPRARQIQLKAFKKMRIHAARNGFGNLVSDGDL